MSSSQAKPLPSSAQNFVTRVAAHEQTQTPIQSRQQSATNEDCARLLSSGGSTTRRRRGRRRTEAMPSPLPLPSKEEELSLSKIITTSGSKHDETVPPGKITMRARAQRLFYMSLGASCLLLLAFQLTLNVCRCQAKQQQQQQHHDPSGK